MVISLISCIDIKNGIGKNGTIPWHIPNDLKYFKKLTKNSVVIMGRKTFESINKIPLKNRINIVVSSLHYYNNVHTVSDINTAIALARSFGKNIFIIGGSSLYKSGLSFANVVYLTQINNDYNCDTFFPYDKMVELFKNKICGNWCEYNDTQYRFEIYKK